ncbi:MAG: hypothetical protein AAF727_14135 [Pseudomonadota bacterium]
MQYEPIPGRPQTATDEETMSVIRSILTEENSAPDVPTAAAAKVTAQKPTQRAFVERKGENTPRRRADDLPALQDVVEETAAAPAPRRPVRSVLRALVAVLRRLRAFRPTTRHLALASLALLTVLRPHWVVVGAVLCLAMVIAMFLIAGADRVWRGVNVYLNRVDARDPQRATELRTRLDSFACRWDAVLDRFPDGMVDGLYMPDFQDMQANDAAHADAMAERLSRMAHDS